MNIDWRAVRHRAQEWLCIVLSLMLLGLYAGVALLALAVDGLKSLQDFFTHGYRHV